MPKTSEKTDQGGRSENKMSKEVIQKIIDGKIIAIIRGISSENIIDLVEAISKGGVYCAEVTFDQSSAEAARDTLVAIKKLTEHFGDNVCVGAGTVMSVEQVRLAAQAGAKYIISPNVDDDVIAETKRLELVSIPGAMTATEVEHAYAAGADIVKLFPAGVLGAPYIKALRAPLKHIPMTAVGSVNAANCAEFFKAGCCGIGVGGNLVNKKLVEEGRFDEITAAAREYAEAIKRL